MSESVRPHRWQPTRLPRPWDSPGKNTGVGCHFLLQCMEVKSESEVAQSCPTPSDPIGLQPTRLLRPWDSPGKSTGVGCHCWLENRAKNRICSAVQQVHISSCFPYAWTSGSHNLMPEQTGIGLELPWEKKKAGKETKEYGPSCINAP